MTEEDGAHIVCRAVKLELFRAPASTCNLS